MLLRNYILSDMFTRIMSMNNELSESTFSENQRKIRSLSSQEYLVVITSSFPSKLEHIAFVMFLSATLKFDDELSHTAWISKYI